MPLLDLLADTAEETNSMLQDRSIEISKSRKRKRDWGKEEFGFFFREKASP